MSDQLWREATDRERKDHPDVEMLAVVPVEPDYEAMKEVLAIPDESGAFFKWHSTSQLMEALNVALKGQML